MERRKNAAPPGTQHYRHAQMSSATASAPNGLVRPSSRPAYGHYLSASYSTSVQRFPFNIQPAKHDPHFATSIGLLVAMQPKVLRIYNDYYFLINNY
jgi:hypothetical protein